MAVPGGDPDRFSRRIVGWSLSRQIDAALVLRGPGDGVAAAVPPGRARCTTPTCGVQYASASLRHLLQREGLTMSMSRKGNPWDNAMMESFFGSLKTEWIDDSYATETQREWRCSSTLRCSIIRPDGTVRWAISVRWNTNGAIKQSI